MKIDKKIIKELSDYLDEFNLTEIEYSENNVKYKVSKSSKGVVHEQIVSTGNQPRSSSPGSSTVANDNNNCLAFFNISPNCDKGFCARFWS